MPHIWTVARPDDWRNIPESTAKLQDQIVAIESLGDETTCHFCGERAPLASEHVPAKKAGDPSRGVGYTIDSPTTAATGRVTWAGWKIQGITVNTLCGRWNNTTGAWYNSA